MSEGEEQRLQSGSVTGEHQAQSDEHSYMVTSAVFMVKSKEGNKSIIFFFLYFNIFINSVKLKIKPAVDVLKTQGSASEKDK